MISINRENKQTVVRILSVLRDFGDHWLRQLTATIQAERTL